MAFPHITIKATNIDVEPTLETLVEEKMRSLEKFIPRDETDVMAEVELEKTTAHHQAGKIFRAEINVKVGGKLFRSEATSETIEDAFYDAKNEMKAELRKVHTKRQSLIRRGGQKIKDMMRFGR